MTKPIPGKQYTVQLGDTLSGIAAKAYGDPAKWPDIYNVNISNLKSNDPDVIYPGEIIFIPENILTENLRSERQRAFALGERDDNTFNLFIENKQVQCISGALLRTMDNINDSWIATFPWKPGLDPELDELIKPYKIPRSKIYLGSKLMGTGYIYKVKKARSGDSRTVTVTGYSKAADIMDSTSNPPYQASNVTLQQRITSLIAPFGLTLLYNLDSDSPFKRVTMEPTDTIFSHIAKLVSQRGALINSNEFGNIVVYKSRNSGPIAKVIEEGTTTANDFEIECDARKRYRTYKAIGQSPVSGTKKGIAIDTNISKPRQLTFTADDADVADIEKAAKFKMTKTLADSMSFSIPVRGWYSSAGVLYKENTFVTVKSETMDLSSGYNMLVKSVTYNFGDKIDCVLELVPPAVYTGENFIDPWTGTQVQVHRQKIVERGLR